MRLSPIAAAAPLTVLVLLLAGCADDEDPAPATDSGETAASPADPLSPLPSTDVPGPVESPTSESTTADPGGGSAAELATAQRDVESLAPALESYYRGGTYPTTAEEVVADLDDAGLSLTPGNTIGSYVYDPDAVEFTLCVETEGGAWATYDTAPMSVRGSGETGGCP